jgi:hypothetical protein
MTKILTKLVNFFRSIARVGGSVFGIRRKKGKWNFEQVTLAAWVFVVGLPIGTLVLGANFNILMWAAIILLCLWLVNVDETMLLIADLTEYGPDGVVESTR